MNARRKADGRGQTLVLFSMTLLLLSLMVLMTLEIGRRVKDRMEAQVVADTAAYSEAVAMARTFNGVALLNRSALASYVALLTTESLISYAGALKGMGTDPTTSINAGLPPGCKLPPGAINPPLPPAGGGGGWAGLDVAAGAQALNEQGAVGTFRGYGTSLLTHLTNHLLASQKMPSGLADAEAYSADQYIPRQIAQKAYPDNVHGDQGALNAIPLALSSEFAACKARRTHWDVDTSCTVTKDGYGNSQSYGDSTNALYAAMGSRGDGFATNRAAVTGSYTGNGGITVTNSAGGGGGSGFGSPNSIMGSEGGKVIGSAQSNAPREAQRWCGSGSGANCVNGVVAWGQDDGGGITITIPPMPTCLKGAGPISINFDEAYVGSSALEYHDDVHWYQGKPEGKEAGKGGASAGPDVNHTLGACTPYCPGVFGGIVGYDAGLVGGISRNRLPQALYAQPVAMPLIVRDYRQRKNGKGEVWNLNFNFRFTAAGPGERYQGGSPTEPDMVSQELREQVVMSSAIAYYHRNSGAPGDPGVRYREPPNFFNPFWRATLISGHIYEDAAKGTGAPPETAFSSVLKLNGYTTAESVANKLYQAGFRGF